MFFSAPLRDHSAVPRQTSSVGDATPTYARVIISRKPETGNRKPETVFSFRLSSSPFQILEIPLISLP